MIEPLLAEVRRLQGVMADHGEYLGNSEAATRAAVIDPVLSMLGWDVHDPAVVKPEYRTGLHTANYVDYAIFDRQQPIALIEAKSLHTTLDGKAQEQLSGYCYHCQPSSVRWGILTSGDRWILIDAFNVEKTLTDRMVQDFSLRTGDSHRVLGALLTLCGTISATHHQMVRTTPRAHVTPLNRTGPSEQTTGEWRPLDQLASIVKKGSKPRMYLRLLDGRQTRVKAFADILQSIILYAIDSGQITAESCPVPNHAGRSRYLVNTEPCHKSGKPFSTTMRGEHRGLYFDVTCSASDTLPNSLHILQFAGIDPATVTWQGRDGWPEHDLGE